MRRKYELWTLVLSVLFFFGIIASTAMAAPLVGKSVNINTASVDEIIKNVPTMTQKLAKDIVKYRNDNGDFLQKEELLLVPGMNRTLLKKWDKFFELEGIGGKDCTC